MFVHTLVLGKINKNVAVVPIFFTRRVVKKWNEILSCNTAAPFFPSLCGQLRKRGSIASLASLALQSLSGPCAALDHQHTNGSVCFHYGALVQEVV